MSLERFCRKPVATVLPSQTVLEAAQRMQQAHVGAVVVVDEANKPIGILTDRDIVCRVVAERRDPLGTPIRAVMSAPVAIARAEDLIEEAAFTMRQKGVRRLPIVSADGKAVGVVALDDLVVLLAAELGQAAAAVRMNRGP
ncbi:MAG: CBS domain-containing protein [Myxococcales bacterium]|nr:CBS domain-containing protein [Myxococcales bacterium]